MAGRTRARTLAENRVGRGGLAGRPPRSAPAHLGPGSLVASELGALDGRASALASDRVALLHLARPALGGFRMARTARLPWSVFPGRAGSLMGAQDRPAGLRLLAVMAPSSRPERAGAGRGPRLLGGVHDPPLGPAHRAILLRGLCRTALGLGTNQDRNGNQKRTRGGCSRRGVCSLGEHPFRLRGWAFTLGALRGCRNSRTAAQGR